MAEIMGAAIQQRWEPQTTVGEALLRDVEDIAKAGREARSESEYLTACEKALRTMQTDALRMAVRIAVLHMDMTINTPKPLTMPVEGKEQAP